MAARPKAYSYLRFSTPEQSKGDSKVRQTKLATEYAARHNLDLDTKLTFHDLGVSAYRGANAETGRLGDFLEAVRVGLVEKGSYLLVESLDRISRKTARKAVRILEEICEAGITLVTLTDGREHTAEALDNDPMTFLMAFLIFVRSNEESATKAQRLRESWVRKRENAGTKALTSACPAWLKLDKATGKFVVIPERAEIVERIFSDALQGVSPHSTALALNVECVPVFGRGKHWHRSYILKILANPAVIGRIVPHTTEYPDGKRFRRPMPAIERYFPRILDDETFQRVESLRLGAFAPMRGKNSGKEVQNIFGGLGRCARCGGTITKLNKGGDGKWSYLVCVAAKTGAGCIYESIPYGQVERAFLENAQRLFANAPTGGETGKQIDAEISEAEAYAEGLTDAVETLLNAAAMTPSPTLTRKIGELKKEQDIVSDLLSELAERSAQTSGALVRSKLADLRAAVDAEPLNRTLLNSLLRQALTSIDVDSENGLLLLHWKHGGESEIGYSAKHYGFENETRKKPELTAGARNRKRSKTKKAAR